MDQNVSEAEALRFKEDRDARIAQIREDMGQSQAQDEAATEVEEESPEAESDNVEIQETVSEDTESEEAEEGTETREESAATKPFSSLTRELNSIRTQKREAEARAEAAEAGKTAWEAERTRLIEENASLKKNAPPPEPFIEYAKSRGIADPKEVKELYDVFKTQLDSELGSKLAVIDQKIATFEHAEQERTQSSAWDESMRKFDAEWSEFLPSIEAEYKPDSAKLQEVYDLVADLSHSEKYHDKDLDYVLYKESEQIEGILGSRKRRTFLPVRGGIKETAERGKSTYGSEHERIMALRSEQKQKINSADGFDKIKDDRI